MQWQSIIIGFLSGIGVSVFSAIVTNIIQKRNNAEQIKEEIRFEVYMKLMEIYSLYWSICVAESQNEECDPQRKIKLWDLSWQVADSIRECDNIEYVEDIINVLFNHNFKLAKDRYNEMKKILKKLGDKVNPKYNKIMIRISDENYKYLEQNFTGSSNAPGVLI